MYIHTYTYILCRLQYHNMSTRGSLTFSQDIRYESILSVHLGPRTDPRVCTTILSTPRDSALGPGSGLHHLLYIASSRMSDSHGNSYNRGLWMSLSLFISLTSLCKRWGNAWVFLFPFRAPQDCCSRPWQHRCSKSRPQRRSKRKLPSSNLSSDIGWNSRHFLRTFELLI